MEMWVCFSFSFFLDIYVSFEWLDSIQLFPISDKNQVCMSRWSSSKILPNVFHHHWNYLQMLLLFLMSERHHAKVLWYCLNRAFAHRVHYRQYCSLNVGEIWANLARRKEDFNQSRLNKRKENLFLAVHEKNIDISTCCALSNVMIMFEKKHIYTFQIINYKLLSPLPWSWEKLKSKSFVSISLTVQLITRGELIKIDRKSI